MKRPSVVYVATALLLLQLANLAWIAAHIPSDPKYLIGKWQFVAIAFGLLAFFYLKPRIGRWYVIPYFAFVGLRSFFALSKVEISAWALASGALTIAYLILAVLLFRLPPTQHRPLGSEKA